MKVGREPDRNALQKPRTPRRRNLGAARGPGKRLDAMLQAVRGVRGALDDFYGRLSDQQKARICAITITTPASAASSGT